MPATLPAAVPRHILPVLVLAQFAGTSLWFAVNAVMPDLQRELGWPATAVGPLTSSLLLDLAARQFGANAVKRFAFRAQSPAFAGRAFWCPAKIRTDWMASGLPALQSG